MSSDEDHALIQTLYATSKKSPKLVKGSVQSPPDDPDVAVTTWKMQEFRYYDIPSPFPTLARGLFTRETNGRYEIIARGYDKFFNIGEVPWNTWESLEAHTGAPYTLSLKSNGCIIFIAAVSSSKVIVTSKHSLTSEHASVGKQWLLKNLEKKGRSLEEFAATLWKNKWTAVAELCDDSFEEHVLPYSPEETGLHLHGLNASSKRFITEDTSVVDDFAREWGFIVTKSTVLDSIPAVRKFTSEVGETGEWDGNALEGFVVRTHVTEPPTKGKASPGQSPYAPGSSFFFKVKFDEPYMMYRDWREVTKMLLGHEGGPKVSKLPKKKMERAETKVYAKWVADEITRDRRQFDGYTANRGIIATRERFQKWLAGQEGKKQVDEADHEEPEEEKKFEKTIIVPVAIPGCGKTTVAVGLTHLFGFGHTQSDDVKAKKPAPLFLKNVENLLKTHDVVIADKNNHLRQHRDQLRDIAVRSRTPTRLLALNWSLSPPPATVHRICGDRISTRGANHQTLRADATPARAHEDVVWQFIQGAQELTGDEVDATVEMDLEWTAEAALRAAADACVRILGVPPPSDDQIVEALEKARAYEPRTKAATQKTPKGKPPRYFGLLVEADLREIVPAALAGAPDAARTFWDKLRADKRVTARPHVTLVHSKSKDAEAALWALCERTAGADAPPTMSFRLGHLLWDGRVMALTVDELAVSRDAPDEKAVGAQFVLEVPEQVKARLHITVGTADADVPPIEGKHLVERWRQQEGLDTVGVVPLEDVFVKGRLRGLMS